MKSRRRIARPVRALTLGLAACAALAAPAAAEPGADYPQPSSVKIGDTPADFARPVSPAPKIGDTPADFARPVSPEPKVGGTPADFARPVTPAPTIGDTPADHPGATRSPDYQTPTTVNVVRPERTIVRNADESLPVILAGLALLVALASAGYAIARTRTLRRGVVH